MKIFLTIIFIVGICMLFPAVRASANLTVKYVLSDSVPDMRLNYKIITNTDNSYGYDIIVNGRLLIHQPSIPGIPGLKGFLRKQDAKKVAVLAMKKVQKGIIPPTIVPKELDSLRIIH